MQASNYLDYGLRLSRRFSVSGKGRHQNQRWQRRSVDLSFRFRWLIPTISTRLLATRILHLCRYSYSAGHLRTLRLYDSTVKELYCPHMTNTTYATVAQLLLLCPKSTARQERKGALTGYPGPAFSICWNVCNRTTVGNETR